MMNKYLLCLYGISSLSTSTTDITQFISLYLFSVSGQRLLALLSFCCIL
jgi:hypothetical protein